MNPEQIVATGRKFVAGAKVAREILQELQTYLKQKYDSFITFPETDDNTVAIVFGGIPIQFRAEISIDKTSDETPVRIIVEQLLPDGGRKPLPGLEISATIPPDRIKIWLSQRPLDQFALKLFETLIPAADTPISVFSVPKTYSEVMKSWKPPGKIMLA